MFLGHLSSSAKELFLKLCVCAAKANGIVDEKEKIMISEYCVEMNIPVFQSFEAEPLNALLEQVRELSNVEKRIIFLELFGLVKIDGVYDKSEMDFMRQFVSVCELSEEMYKKIDTLLDKYTALCNELYQTIFLQSSTV